MTDPALRMLDWASYHVPAGAIALWGSIEASGWLIRQFDGNPYIEGGIMCLAAAGAVLGTYRFVEKIRPKMGSLGNGLMRIGAITAALVSIGMNTPTMKSISLEYMFNRPNSSIQQTLDFNRPLEELVDNRVDPAKADALSGKDKTLAQGLKYEYIFQHAASTAPNISPELLQAIAWVESHYNVFAVSYLGAGGMMQFMPKTAREEGMSPIIDMGRVSKRQYAKKLRRIVNSYGRNYQALARRDQRFSLESIVYAAQFLQSNYEEVKKVGPHWSERELLKETIQTYLMGVDNWKKGIPSLERRGREYAQDVLEAEKWIEASKSRVWRKMKR